MGPTLIYDKSAIHSFSEREAYWLTNLYAVNMTPVLFMEIMADLKKYPNDLPLSAHQVKVLAKKFSPYCLLRLRHAHSGGPAHERILEAVRLFGDRVLPYCV